jgi:aspartyl-tRNA(Asn)/glutamyl-tRNA(Gln) amidotransferase subunit A
MILYNDFLNEIKSKKITAFEFTNQIVSKIKSNIELNAFITITEERALNQAKESDLRFQEGTQRPLEGMIIAIKDNISTKDIRTTCASKMLENYSPIYDATVITRIKEAGGIIIGKTNMDEFAMGSSNETSFFGSVKNPLNHNKIPGGSSGGSASAVSSGLCHLALGSDTGGSIRQPASFCGIYGYKPSYGRISRYGLIAFASSLDQIGFLSSEIDSISRITDVLSGEDEKDSTCLKKPKISSLGSLNNFPSKFKVGVMGKNLLEKCNSEVYETYCESIEKIKALGGEIVDVDFRFTEAWIPTYYILATAEASSNLSRFDGVRFGLRANLSDKQNIYKATRSQGFGSEVKRRIMTGTYVLSSGYYDAYYKKAQQVRRVICDDYNTAFSKVDFIFIPTTPSTAFGFNEKSADPVMMYLSDFFTASANLAGIPGINIPIKNNSVGMPIGMQIQTKHLDDKQLLMFANFLGHKLKN